MYIFFREKIYDRKSVSFVTGEILFQVYITLACAQKSNISFIARGKVPFLHNPVANHVLVSAAVSGIQFLRATKEIGDVCRETDMVPRPKSGGKRGGGGGGAGGQGPTRPPLLLRASITYKTVDSQFSLSSSRGTQRKLRINLG